MFDGQRIDELSDKELTEQRTRFGFVFQNAALFDSMTVAENVAVPAAASTARRRRRERAARCSSLLAEVGLPKSVLTKQPAELSGGMRKRVGLARALAMNPEVMLYDEPTTGLDPIMSDVINELIIRTRDKHQVTSIVVTHDMTHGPQGGRPRRDALPARAAGAGRIANHLRRPARRARRRRRTAASRQFVRGEAGERLMEIERTNGGDSCQLSADQLLARADDCVARLLANS